MEDFDRDEFDEFGKFNRDELNRLFRQRMADEEFKKRFMNIIGGYQRDYEGIMRLLSTGMFGNNPFSGSSTRHNPMDPSHFNRNSFLDGLDFTGLNEDGWSGEHWESEDGRTHISSFTRSVTPEDYHQRRRERNDEELPTEHVIGILETKLKKALSLDTSEGYKKAAELKNTIDSLKKGEDSKNDDKNEEK
jgi:hypothetical protein